MSTSCGTAFAARRSLYISPISPIYLPYVSPTSLYLPYISIYLHGLRCTQAAMDAMHADIKALLEMVG